MRSVILFLFCFAQSVWALDGKAILEQVDKNMEPDSYEMYRKLINIRPDGKRREFVIYTLKKGRDRMAALFLAPPREEGRSMLRIGDNMWLSIPDVPQPLRIAHLQSVVGGIFDNADIMRLELSREYEVETVEELKDEYLLSLKAKNRWSTYDQVKLWVDKEHTLPKTVEIYAGGGILIKTVRFRDIKDYGDGIVRPSVIEIESPHYAGHKAVMLFVDIRKRDFPEEVFTLNFLPRLEELRK